MISAEIMLDHRAHAAVAGLVPAERCSLELKGFAGPVEAHRVAAEYDDLENLPARSGR